MHLQWCTECACVLTVMNCHSVRGVSWILGRMQRIYGYLSICCIVIIIIITTRVLTLVYLLLQALPKYLQKIQSTFMEDLWKSLSLKVIRN